MRKVFSFSSAAFSRMTQFHLARPGHSLTAAILVGIVVAAGAATAQGSCGDWLDHGGASSVSHKLHTPADLPTPIALGTQLPKSPAGKPCDGPACENAPSRVPLPSRAPLPLPQDNDQAVYDHRFTAIGSESTLGQFFGAVIAHEGFSPRVERPPRS